MVQVVADDTDIAVMLLHHWHEDLNDIIFTSECSKKSWSVKECVKSLSPGVKSVLPFIHALSGSDSTSAIFGIGKPTVLKKFKGS